MQEDLTPRNPLARVYLILRAHERSQAWLARKLGVDRALITNIAKGRRPLTRAIIDGCARVLAVPAHILFDARDLPDGNLTKPDGNAQDGDSIAVADGDEPNGEAA